MSLHGCNNVLSFQSISSENHIYRLLESQRCQIIAQSSFGSFPVHLSIKLITNFINKYLHVLVSIMCIEFAEPINSFDVILQ